jgi:hypothetical protein
MELKKKKIQDRYIISRSAVASILWRWQGSFDLRSFMRTVLDHPLSCFNAWKCKIHSLIESSPPMSRLIFAYQKKFKKFKKYTLCKVIITAMTEKPMPIIRLVA